MSNSTVAGNTTHPLLPFKYTLVACYALLCVYAASRLYYHSKYHHSKRSFTFGLLCLVLVWSLLRTCFWLATSIGPRHVQEADSNTYFIVLKVVFYWVPFALQFTSYSVFSLFLGKVVYREQWKKDKCKRTFLATFVTSNAIIFIFVMVWATWSTMIAIRSPLIPVTPANHPNTTTTAAAAASEATVPSAQDAAKEDPIPWVPVQHATCEIQMLDAVLEAVMGSSFTILFLSFTGLTIKYFSITTQVTRRMLVFHPRHLGALCVRLGCAWLNLCDQDPSLCCFVLSLFFLFSSGQRNARLSCRWSFCPEQLLIFTILVRN